MIQIDASVYCQRPFRRQIEVFKQEKDKKKSDENSIAVKFSDKISENWSSMMLFNSEIIMILLLVDDNSLKGAGERKHSKNHAFAKACRAKRTSHLFHEANCLRLFLAQVWELTISRSSRRIFRGDNAFNHPRICAVINVVPWSCPLGGYQKFWLTYYPSDPMAMTRAPAYGANKKCGPIRAGASSVIFLPGSLRLRRFLSTLKLLNMA